MNKFKQQSGFGIVGIITLVVVIALVGVGGWYVWQAQNKSNIEQSLTSGQVATQKTQLKMASDKVIFDLPDRWAASGRHSNTDCSRTISSEVTCLDETTIYPSGIEKVAGVPRYSVMVTVYARGNSTTAKDWWENSYKGDNGTTNVSGVIVEPSTARINGYDAYRFKLDRSSGDQLQNIIAGDKYVVLVTALLDEGASSADNAREWRPYVPAIHSFVNSIKIQ